MQFIKTGYETDISYSCMIHGEIRDPYFPIYFQVGSLGKISVKEYLKEISLWRGMISRCYNINDDNYIYYGEKGVTVCDRWLCCETFVEDIPLIKGYNKDLFLQGQLELDKDIKNSGMLKQYNLTNCQFVSRRVNHNEMMLRKKPHTSSKYVGVTRLKDGKWQASISYQSKNLYIGRYNTEIEAHLAYIDKYNELYDN